MTGTDTNGVFSGVGAGMPAPVREEGTDMPSGAILLMTHEAQDRTDFDPVTGPLSTDQSGDRPSIVDLM